MLAERTARPCSSFLETETSRLIADAAKKEYNDCVMRKAVEQVRPLPYSLLGDKKKGIPQYNCQDYADALRNKYNELIKDKKVRCECGLSVKKQGAR